MSTIKNNSDFLFIFESIMSNPNGDPDQENKPRMDYDTDTNLCTDSRVKRDVRDLMIEEGIDVFVSMEEGAKVSGDSKLEAVINKLLLDTSFVEKIFSEEESYKKIFEDLRTELEKRNKDKKDDEKELIFKALQGKKNIKLNSYILSQIIKDKFPDIRMFGGAFAVAGFNKPYTGPIQINWGYSLNRVELVESNSIVTIMNDDNSTFGKDYRVYYSLLAFNGTVNKFQAKKTGLSDEDLQMFRDYTWNAVSALPTRSKLNQYPKLYLEIGYNDGFYNGHFGDLRQYVRVSPKDEIADNKVRALKDLNIDLSALKALIEEDSKNDKAIRSVYLKSSEGFDLDISEKLQFKARKA